MHSSEIYREGDRAVLLIVRERGLVIQIEDRGVLQFPVLRSVLQSIETGIDVQVSQGEEYCLLRSDGRMVSIDYSRPGGGRGRIAVSELSLLLALSQ